MSTNDKDWFVELGLVRDQEKIMEWGVEAYPFYVKNRNLIAQLWYTQVLGKVLPTPQTIISVEELRKKAKEIADTGEVKTPEGKDKRVWGALELLIVGPLGDGRPYFGCAKCLKGVDKNVGVCINEEKHPGEQIDGQTLTWQNWQAGDSTGDVVISFAPNKKQTPHTIQGNILTVTGSMSLRDGRYTIWEIVKNKHAGANVGTSLKNTTLEPVVEVSESEVTDVGENISDQSTEKDDEESFEDAEEDVGAKVFEGLEDVKSEDPEGGIESLIEGFGSLEKRFKNALKRYVGKKTVEKEVLVRWVLVQPQFRTLPEPEGNQLADSFLQNMEKRGYISIDAEDKLKSLVGV